MKKSISINLQGLLFHIEEDGYEMLRRYLADVKQHFSAYAGHEEIVADIEARIAELFADRLSGRQAGHHPCRRGSRDGPARPGQRVRAAGRRRRAGQPGGARSAASSRQTAFGGSRRPASRPDRASCSATKRTRKSRA